MTRATVSADGETITVRIPLTFRKRGGRKLVVMPDGAKWAPRPWVDNAMIKALARAFRWQRMLDEGTCATIEDLSRRRKSTEATYVRCCDLRCSHLTSWSRFSTGGTGRR